MKKFNTDNTEFLEMVGEMQNYINELSINQQYLSLTVDILLNILESKKLITKKQMQQMFKKMQNKQETQNIKSVHKQKYLDWLIKDCTTHGNA